MRFFKIIFVMAAACASSLSSADEGADNSDSRVVDKGAAILLSRAERGDTESKLSVALSYAQGQKGFPKDIGLSMKWFLSAANDGNAYAQNFIASAYSKGEGVGKSENLAAQWWRKAADLGYAEAMYNMATCCAQGFGVRKDYNAAVEWWL